MAYLNLCGTVCTQSRISVVMWLKLMLVNHPFKSNLKTLFHDSSPFDVRKTLFVTKSDTQFSVYCYVLF